MKTKKSIIKELKTSCLIISKERDKIREYIEEYNSILVCVDDGLELLLEGVEKISEVI